MSDEMMRDREFLRPKGFVTIKSPITDAAVAGIKEAWAKTSGTPVHTVIARNFEQTKKDIVELLEKIPLDEDNINLLAKIKNKFEDMIPKDYTLDDYDRANGSMPAGIDMVSLLENI